MTQHKVFGDEIAFATWERSTAGEACDLCLSRLRSSFDLDHVVERLAVRARERRWPAPSHSTPPQHPIIIVTRSICRVTRVHFCDRLEAETDAAARSLLHRLLVQEEDKLGHNSEALGEIENHIARAKGHVNRQQALLASSQRDGHDTTQALVLLNAYGEILLAYENQREKILIKVQQSRL